MNIKEGNRLIAKFMGGASGDGIGGLVFSWCKEGHPPVEPICHEKYLQYHSSWDWIMPVVEKIKSYVLNDNPYSGLLDKADVLNLYITAPIETVWLAAVEFIKAEINNVKVEK